MKFSEKRKTKEENKADFQIKEWEEVRSPLKGWKGKSSARRGTMGEYKTLNIQRQNHVERSERVNSKNNRTEDKDRISRLLDLTLHSAIASPL